MEEIVLIPNSQCLTSGIQLPGNIPFLYLLQGKGLAVIGFDIEDRGAINQVQTFYGQNVLVYLN